MPHKQITPRPTTLSIGGATYDLFLSLGAGATHEGHIVLKGGEKITVEGVTETCGGGACNTSVGLSRLGCAASFCGIVGTDQWGTRLLDTMKQEGVRTDSATVVEGETSSFSIIVTLPTRDRSIFVSPGTSEHLGDATFDKSAIAAVDCVYLNRLCASACEIENDLIEMLLSSPRVFLAWNPGGPQITAGIRDSMKRSLLSRTSLLLLNKEEALAFTQTKRVEDALRSLTDAGVKIVCITDGSNGVTASDGTATYHCPVIENATIVDTTGAGDAFGTAVTWALLQGRPLPEALIAGTLNATSVLGAVGAQAGLLTESSLLATLKKNSLHVTFLPR